VDLIQDDPFALQSSEERFGILQQTADSGEFAVEILDPVKRMAQGGLARPPDAGEPDEGPVPPAVLDDIDPVLSLDKVSHRT